MGKGRVIAAHGEGRYTIEVIEDRARAEIARQQAVTRITHLDGRISELAHAIGTAQQAVNTAASQQDAAITQYRAEILQFGESDIDLASFAQTLQQAVEARNALQVQSQHLKGERLALQARILRIDALPPLRQIEAWCADYTEDLTGEVATAEIPGEVGQVLIKPGFHDGAAWSASSDGAIQPALAGTPASVFYNLAMMPGWQKWQPTFRIGTISNIDNDLCSITLDPATSSQQGLSVNVQSHYASVPIMYMDCNGGAFENGDRVLVAFSGNSQQPMVVGFERDPKECSAIVCVLSVDISVRTGHLPNGFASGPTEYPSGPGLSTAETPWAVSRVSVTVRRKAAYRKGPTDESISEFEWLQDLSGTVASMDWVSLTTTRNVCVPRDSPFGPSCFDVRTTPILTQAVANSGHSAVLVRDFYSENYSDSDFTLPLYVDVPSIGATTASIEISHSESVSSQYAAGRHSISSWFAMNNTVSVGSKLNIGNLNVESDAVPGFFVGSIFFSPKGIIGYEENQDSNIEEESIASAEFKYPNRLYIVLEMSA